jgi:hypothetical protein
MNYSSLIRNRRRAWLRGLLAGPMCFVTAVLVMAGAALWFPKGAAEINNIALPIIGFPAIWAVLFFYTLLDRHLSRAWVITSLLCLGHGALIGQHVVAIQAALSATKPAAEASAKGATP